MGWVGLAATPPVALSWTASSTLARQHIYACELPSCRGAMRPGQPLNCPAFPPTPLGLERRPADAYGAPARAGAILAGLSFDKDMQASCRFCHCCQCCVGAVVYACWPARAAGRRSWRAWRCLAVSALLSLSPCCSRAISTCICAIAPAVHRLLVSFPPPAPCLPALLFSAASRHQDV